MQRKNHRDVAHGSAGSLEVRADVPGPGYRHVVTLDHLRRFFALIPDWAEASKGLRAVILGEGSGRTEGWYEDGVIGLTAWPDPVATTVNAWHFSAHCDVWERLGVGSRPAPEFIAAIDMRADEGSTLAAAILVLEDHFDLCDWSVEPSEAGSEWIVLDRSAPPAAPVICDLVRVDDEVHIYQRCVFMRFDRDTAAAYQLLHVFLHELGHHVDATSRPRRGALTRGEDYAEHWAHRTADTIWSAYMDAFCSRRSL